MIFCLCLINNLKKTNHEINIWNKWKLRKSASKYSGRYLTKTGPVNTSGEGRLSEDFTNLAFPCYFNTQLEDWKSKACRGTSGNSCINLMLILWLLLLFLNKCKKIYRPGGTVCICTSSRCLFLTWDYVRIDKLMNH